MASSTSQAMPAAATAGFNPADVSATEATSWCSSQIQSCPEICGGSASTNICDSTTFTYTCICSDGSIPDCTAYTGTLPFYICQATFSQCISNNPNDAQAQATCTNNEQCGTKDPASVPVKASTTSSPASSTSNSPTPVVSSTTSSSSSKSTSRSTTPVSSSSTSSSTSAISTKSKTSSASPAPTPATGASSTSHGSSSLSTGAAAGIGVGCTIGALIFIGLIAYFLIRRRRRSKTTTITEPRPDPAPDAEKSTKPELHGDLATVPSSGMRSADMHDKPEMFTNANRHEMEDTDVAATLGRPWSAELPERGYA